MYTLSSLYVCTLILGPGVSRPSRDARIEILRLRAQATTYPYRPLLTYVLSRRDFDILRSSCTLRANTSSTSSSQNCPRGPRKAEVEFILED